MQQIDPVGKIYAAIGKDEPFYALVERFYAGVEKDSVLRPMYPEDLGPPREHLALFLIQRTGGAQTYSEQRGHPRMRARHLPFKIGEAEKDAWLRNMRQALLETPEFAPHFDVFWEFLVPFAAFMINQPS